MFSRAWWRYKHSSQTEDGKRTRTAVDTFRHKVDEGALAYKRLLHSVRYTVARGCSPTTIDVITYLQQPYKAIYTLT